MSISNCFHIYMFNQSHIYVQCITSIKLTTGNAINIFHYRYMHISQFVEHSFTHTNIITNTYDKYQII